MSALGFDIAADLLRPVAAKAKEEHLHRGTSSFTPAVPLRFSSRGTTSMEVSVSRAHPSTPEVWSFMRACGRRPEKTSNVEKALWATRLSFEQGLHDLPEVPNARLTGEFDGTAAAVFQGFRLLVRCRWALVYGAPVVFEHNFAAAWCGVTAWQAKEARFRLSRAGYMVAVGKHGLSIEWLPRGAE
jgi:hypothetical protein